MFRISIPIPAPFYCWQAHLKNPKQSAELSLHTSLSGKKKTKRKKHSVKIKNTGDDISALMCRHTFSVDHLPHLGQGTPQSALQGDHVPAEQQGRDEQVDPNIAGFPQARGTDLFLLQHSWPTHRRSLEGRRAEVIVSLGCDKSPLEGVW